LESFTIVQLLQDLDERNLNQIRLNDPDATPVTGFFDSVQSPTPSFIDGPEVFLNPNAAEGFALILHELATNAAKHGSLTADAGTVSVHWSIDASAAEPTIVFQWQERGGPPVTPPKRKGFGTVLLERAVATSGSPPHFDFSQEGFTYEVRATLAQQSRAE
jgi:two-component sensor histidine kinase